MIKDNNTLRITFENHGRKQIAEMPFDASLPEIMQRFCNILVANGWSRESVADLFMPESDSDTNNPFEWEIY